MHTRKPRVAGLAVALAALVTAGISMSPSVHSADSSADPGDIALIAGFFPTFGAVLKASGQVDVLRGAGPFTVFAPAEGAFGALPAGQLDDLLKPANRAALRDVVGYHVVAGPFTAADLKGMTSLTTLQGARLEVKTGAGGITINGARITTADTIASNGVIHIVNRVLMPPG
jgi:uncharacterized surface protein with fasciclin (FAS1) repeats